MKHIILTVASVLLLASISFGQRKLSEATIYYDIVINTSNATPSAADMLDGATLVISLKGASSRSDMISSLGKQSTIIDGRTGSVAILKEYGNQKFMTTLTKDDWGNSNKKYDGIAYAIQNDFKTIAGYNCQKAIGKLQDGTSFTVYFTKELVPENDDFQYMTKNLPGLAMQYEASLGKTKVVYTVSQINFNVVPLSKFDLPKAGYRVMTYGENMRAN